MGIAIPHAANHKQPCNRGLIMTSSNIHNFQYFLNELRKNLDGLETLFEKELITLKNMNVLHSVMAKMCENWENQLENQ